MRFGIALPNFRSLGTPPALVEIAQQAEVLGYHSIWATDIVVQTRSAADERFAYSLEALTLTAHLAAVTTRVQWSISVLVLPQRSPVLVAKEVATLDCLSGGRLVLGVGAGYHEMQFRWLGADFRRRGQRLDEYILAMRELWTAQDPASRVSMSSSLMSCSCRGLFSRRVPPLSLVAVAQLRYAGWLVWPTGGTRSA